MKTKIKISEKKFWQLKKARDAWDIWLNFFSASSPISLLNGTGFIKVTNFVKVIYIADKKICAYK